MCQALLKGFVQNAPFLPHGMSHLAHKADSQRLYEMVSHSGKCSIPGTLLHKKLSPHLVPHSNHLITLPDSAGWEFGQSTVGMTVLSHSVCGLSREASEGGGDLMAEGRNH